VKVERSFLFSDFRYCDSLDKQIYELVFDLYGLSKEERRIIEGKLITKTFQI
jgi:hypothetical protein